MRLTSLMCFILTVGLTILTQAEPAGPLRLAQRIPLPGVAGRIDHFTCDVAGKRLFVAALGNGTVEVIDLASARRIASLGKLEEPQGLLYEPTARRLFVASGGDGMCRAYDASTSAAGFPLLAAIAVGEDADNLRLDPASGEIFVGIQGGLAILDATALKKVGAIPFAGHAEAFCIERGGPRVYVNVPGEKMLLVLDRRKHEVLARWPMRDPAQNFPIALDEAGRRLFVGCRKPAALQVLDAATGNPKARLKIGADTDDLFYDASRSQIYVCCGQGIINVFRQAASGAYEPIATIPTAPGARTALFVPELSRLYVAAPKRDGHEAEIQVYELAP